MYVGKTPLITESVSLGDVLCGSDEGRTSEKTKICFIASSMTVWYVAWGYELYKNAQEKGWGQVLKLWDDPYLA